MGDVYTKEQVEEIIANHEAKTKEEWQCRQRGVPELRLEPSFRSCSFLANRKRQNIQFLAWA